MIRLSTLTALGITASSVLTAAVALADPPPPPAILPPSPTATPPLVAGQATAIAGVTPTFVTDVMAPRKPNGWDMRFSAGGTLSFANNSNVVGQADGTSFTFGAKIDGAFDYNYDKHEWRNTLGIVEGLTRTPVIDDWVKTSDSLSVDTIYLYHVLSWFGPFVRFSLQTSLFKGTDVRPATVNPDGTVGTTYKITDSDGVSHPVTLVAKSLPLSDPFRPLTLKQSIGLFVQPYQTDPLTIELRAGAGAQEVLANNQLAISDDPTTLTVVEVKRLQNVNQVGPELAASFWGSVVDKRVTYRANADVLVPVVHGALLPGDTRKPLQLTDIQLDATLSFKLVEWASLDYQVKAIRQPEVLDAFQVQNSLLLTFGISLPAKPPPPCAPGCVPPPPPPASAPPPPTPASAPPPAAPPP